MPTKTRMLLNMIMLMIGSIIFPIISKGQSAKTRTNQQKTSIQNKYGLDPSTPLTGRIIQTSPEILQTFRSAGMSPTIHRLTKADSLKVVSAFSKLPSLHKNILKDHLLGISFLDNMPNTALTARVNSEDPFPLFTITFRAEILKQDVSQWLTEKELSYFTKNHPGLSISIEAGKLDAILYVLLHEATHVIDGSLGILSNDVDKKDADMSKNLKGFSDNIWVDRTNISLNYADTLTTQSRFRGSSRLLPIELAQRIYQSAAHRPFVSLYSTSSWHEDLAEYLTVSHFTEKLKQPFRIIIYKDRKKIFTYEPMKSNSVRSRLELMEIFYRKII